MIKHWIITGDTHGWVETRLGNIYRNIQHYKPEETAVIILGDAGLNFWLNGSDKKHKRAVDSFGYQVYCVRGNHEERPENLSYFREYDINVHGFVYLDPIAENVKYLIDGGEYTIDGHSCLVIGGAYSIDKWYRLMRAGYMPEEAETADPKKCGWFKDEQLTAEEMAMITQQVKGKHYDLVLTHTTALDWEPIDLFLNGIDQSKVDKTMEVWLNEIKDTFSWKVWLFGHYHADRVERPYVEQFYQEYEPLSTLWERWQKYDETHELDWWTPVSPVMREILSGQTS